MSRVGSEAGCTLLPVLFLTSAAIFGGSRAFQPAAGAHVALEMVDLGEERLAIAKAFALFSTFGLCLGVC
jgi:hypothetical protein